jgi:hypothetical protein
VLTTSSKTIKNFTFNPMRFITLTIAFLMSLFSVFGQDKLSYYDAPKSDSLNSKILYVSGVVDSITVDTTSGTGWVYFNGDSLAFEFDPPDATLTTIKKKWYADRITSRKDTSFSAQLSHRYYPIIIHDDEGNSYIIYPDGRIENGTYFVISDDYLNVSAADAVNFEQHEAEIFGFDAKAHTQWHAQYEIIEFSDSSKYFVANKSLGVDQSDLVKALVPEGLSNVTFKLDNGQIVSASPFGGGQGGGSSDSSMVSYEVEIPAFSSKGEYAIYAYAGNSRLGKLNLHVYEEKEIDVVIVPVANITIDSAAVSSAVNDIFNDANIKINISTATQWNNASFTPTTKIEMPSDVSHFSKYSDDMRNLRDAYFDSVPNADKGKYYLFVVDGFNGGDEDGYMVRGKGVGFVSKSATPLTYAHELGQGAGALEHTWNDNGPDQGTTDNLMDYAGGNNLTSGQWKELRKLRLVPSFWDSEEDGMMANLLISEFSPLKFEVHEIEAVPKSEFIDYNPLIYELNKYILVKFKDKNFSHLLFLNGYHVGFRFKIKEEIHDVIKRTHYLSDIIIDEQGREVAQKDNSNALWYLCSNLSCRKDRYDGDPIYYNGNPHYRMSTTVEHEYYSNDYDIISCPDLKYVKSKVLTFCENGQQLSVIPSEIQDQYCDDSKICSRVSNYDEVDEYHVEWIVNAIQSIVGNGYNIASASSLPIKEINDGLMLDNLGFSYPSINVVSDKFKLLNHYREDKFLMHIILKINDKKGYSNANVKELANRAIIEYNKNNPHHSIGLILTVYCSIPSNYPGISESLGVCSTTGFASSNSISVGQEFDDFTLSDIKEIDKKAQYIFTSVKKPYYVTNIYCNADKSFTYKPSSNIDEPSKDVSGLPFIVTANVYKSKILNEYEVKFNKISSDYIEDSKGSDGTWYSEYPHDKYQALRVWLENNKGNEKINRESDWQKISVNWTKYKERFLVDKKLLGAIAKETDLDCDFCTDFAVLVGVKEIQPYHYYDFNYFSVIDPIVYNSLDFFSVIPGIDLFTDGIGVLYSSLRGDWGNSAIYSASLSVPFVGSGVIKKIAYFVEKTPSGNYNIVAKSLDDNLDQFVKISSDADVLNENLSTSLLELNSAGVKPTMAESRLKSIFDLAEAGRKFTTSELALLKRADLPDFVTNNLDDLLSLENRTAIWELNNVSSGQFKRGDLIEEIFNQWGNKYGGYQNLNDIIPNYRTLDFDGVLANIDEVVSLKTFKPVSNNTLSNFKSTVRSNMKKLNDDVAIGTNHSGKDRVLDFTIENGTWSQSQIDDVYDYVDDLLKDTRKFGNVSEVRITEF